MEPDLPPGPVCVLGNPVSGRGRGEALIRRAAERLRADGREVIELRTDRPGAGVTVARSLPTECVLAVVVGGDGTVRDAAEGLDGRDLPVAIVPAGTGNDLARELGLPRGPAAADWLPGRGVRRVDRWSWNGRLFVNAAGVGIDAAVARTVNERFRRLRGTLAYVAGFLTVLPRYQPLEYRLRWPDGDWSGRAWLIAAGNGTSYGGGMRIAPGAVLDDGLLEVVIVRGTGRVALLRQFPLIFRGTHVRSPDVIRFAAGEVRIESPPHVAALDGELLSGSPARVHLLPGSLLVRVP